MGTGAATIFGTTGSVAEAVARCVVEDKSRNTFQAISFSDLRGTDAIRSASLPVGDRAREFSSSLAAGQGHSTLPRTVIISIIDFNLFSCTEFYSFFQLLETTRHTLLSDKMGFRFFELTKLPDDINEKDSLCLSSFRTNTEEELEKIRAMEVPETEQAINAIPY